MPGDKDPAAQALFDLITSQRITATIYVAARLGIADVMADGARTASEIAQRTEAHEPSVRRLLRALVSIGVCEQAGADAYVLTAMGSHLAAKAPGSQKGWALFEGSPIFWQSWGGLFDSVKTGQTGAEIAGTENMFELMDPELVALFNDAMVSVTRLVVPAVIETYDFSGIGMLIDVGGGYGHLLGPILRKHPTMRGAIYDLARCEEGAKRLLADHGVSERGGFIPGDFFQSVPSGADALILKSVLHDWNDELSLEILVNCKRALKTGAKLLVIERVMPEVVTATTDDASVTLSDLNMLRGPGGRERTLTEHRDLLTASGFALARVVTAGRSHVLEAIAQ